MYPQNQPAYPPVQPRRRRFNPVWLLAVIPICLICLIGGVVAIRLAPGLILQSFGLAPQGDVETFWVEQLTVEPVVFGTPYLPPAPPSSSGGGGSTPAANVPPTAVAAASGDGQQAAPSGGGASGISAPYAGWFQSATAPQAVVVSVEGGATVNVNSAEVFADSAQVGQAVDGYGLGVIQLEESDLSTVCATLLQGCAMDQFVVNRVDFRPNGAVIYATVNVANMWQEVGVVLTITPDGTGFAAEGVVVDGTLYTLPPSGEIADLVNRIINNGNAALDRLRVQANGYALGLVQIVATDTSLTLVLR